MTDGILIPDALGYALIGAIVIGLAVAKIVFWRGGPRGGG